MSSPSSREHDLDAERQRRASLLPPNAACEACGDPDPLLLDADVSLVLCADDAAIDQGRESVERHHLGRRGWNIVLDLTPNWHRVLSTLQRLRGRMTNCLMAELLYGIADLIYAIADYLKNREKGEADTDGRARARVRSD
jgi:hypothetical protein